MPKNNFVVIMLTVFFLTFSACGKTKTAVVNSSKIDEDEILKELFMKEINPWKEIEKGYYTNEDGSEIIVTDENRWRSLLQEYGKQFIYPVRDYQTKDEIIRIPDGNLNEASKKFWEASGLNYSLNKFRRIYNLNDISFIGILQIYEHECANYVIKDGVGYLQSRVDESNVYWNIPDDVPKSDKSFDPGNFIKNEVVIEK